MAQSSGDGQACQGLNHANVTNKLPLPAHALGHSKALLHCSAGSGCFHIPPDRGAACVASQDIQSGNTASANETGVSTLQIVVHLHTGSFWQPGEMIAS